MGSSHEKSDDDKYATANWTSQLKQRKSWIGLTAMILALFFLWNRGSQASREIREKDAVLLEKIHQADSGMRSEGATIAEEHWAAASKRSAYALPSASDQQLSLGQQEDPEIWLHDQRFFCTLAPFLTLKETVEKHVLFGSSLSFLMFLLPFGRDIVSTEIHAHRGWDNTKTREMLKIMQGGRPRLNYTLSRSQTFTKTPRGQMGPEEKERVFLDIGANVGWFTLNIAAAGYKVISFEPLQHNEIALRASICRNDFQGQVRYFNVGLGSHEGKCAIYSESKNVGDGHVICRTEEEIQEAKRVIAAQTPPPSATSPADAAKTFSKVQVAAAVAAAGASTESSRTDISPPKFDGAMRKPVADSVSVHTRRRLLDVVLALDASMKEGQDEGIEATPADAATTKPTDAVTDSPSPVEPQQSALIRSPAPPTGAAVLPKLNEAVPSLPVEEKEDTVETPAPAATTAVPAAAFTPPAAPASSAMAPASKRKPMPPSLKSKMFGGKSSKDLGKEKEKQKQQQPASPKQSSSAPVNGRANRRNRWHQQHQPAAQTSAGAAGHLPGMARSGDAASSPALRRPIAQSKSTVGPAAASGTGLAAYRAAHLRAVPSVYHPVPGSSTLSGQSNLSGGIPTPPSSTALVRMKSLALTKEWNTTGHLPRGYFVRNEVSLKRLDSIVKETIHLMKIDVEGFEGHVLGGAHTLFDRYKVRYIVAEFSPDMLVSKGSDPAQDFLAFFHSRGYEIRNIVKGFNIDQRVLPEQFETFCRSAPPKVVARQCELFIHRPEDVDRD